MTYANSETNSSRSYRKGSRVLKGQRSRSKTRPIIESVPVPLPDEDETVGESVSEERKPWGLGGPATLDESELLAHVPRGASDFHAATLGDLHGEWVDEKLFAAQLRYIKDTSPSLVVVGGDTPNFDIISRWQDKILKKMGPLAILKEIKREIDQAKRLRERIREAAGNALIVEVEGNHCDRLRKYLSDDLHEGWETAKRWMAVEDHFDHYYNRAGVYIRPRFLVRHGDTTAQNPAKKEYNDTHESGWTYHLHVAHQYFEKPFPLTGERFVHTIVPASCRLDANYGSGNAGIMRWHQGMAAGSFSLTDPHDHTTDIGLWNGKHLRIRGERY